MKYLARVLYPTIVGLVIGFAVFPVESVQAVNNFVSMVVSGGYPTGTSINSSGVLTNALTATDIGAVTGGFSGDVEIDGDLTISASGSLDIGAGAATISSTGTAVFEALSLPTGSLTIGDNGGTGGTIRIYPQSGIASRGFLNIQMVGNSSYAGGTTLTLADQAAARTYTIPDAGASSSFVMTEGAQTVNGVKTFGSTIVGSINGNAATVTTNANLTGPITSVGNATTIADAELAAIAGLTSAADKAPVFSGSGTASLLTVKSGTWTPTVSAGVNIDSTSNAAGNYIQIGNQVTCAFALTLDPTAAASTLTTFEITIPVASNFSTSRQCNGSGGFDKTPGAAAVVYGSAANDTALIQFFSTSTASGDIRGTFVYSVI